MRNSDRKMGKAAKASILSGNCCLLPALAISSEFVILIIYARSSVHTACSARISCWCVLVTDGVAMVVCSVAKKNPRKLPTKLEFCKYDPR